jgi:DNA polymerase-4
MLFASVEQMDNPALRKAICGWWFREQVVAAASYEARKFGVRSATSGVMAKKYCQRLFFVKPRFDRYKRSFKQDSRFFMSTDLVEPLS